MRGSIIRKGSLFRPVPPKKARGRSGADAPLRPRQSLSVSYDSREKAGCGVVAWPVGWRRWPTRGGRAVEPGSRMQWNVGLAAWASLNLCNDII